MPRPPRRSTLFPYTTLFRSRRPLLGDDLAGLGEHLLERLHGSILLYSQKSMANSIKRSEEHTSELQSLTNLVCRLLLEKKNRATPIRNRPFAGWTRR